MKKILTDKIAAGKGQAFGKQSLDHLQAAFPEITEALVEAVNQGRKQVVYLQGCTITTVGTVHSNAAGWAYYAGEVFLVSEGAVDTAGVPEWVVQEDFVTGGSVPFSNLDMHDVLAIRTLRLAAAGSGGVAVTGAETYPALLASMHQHSIEQVGGLPDVLALMANKQQSAFTDVSAFFSGGIDNRSGDIVGYMKDEFGFVHLKGTVATSAGVGANTYILFNLPSAFRPNSGTRYFGNKSLNASIFAQVHVSSNGDVVVNSSGDDFVTLNGISFYVGN